MAEMHDAQDPRGRPGRIRELGPSFGPDSVARRLQPRDGSFKNVQNEELVAMWQDDGDEAARALLVSRFEPLLRCEARRKGWVDPEDFLQQARLAVLRAADTHEREQGSSFSTTVRYAIMTECGPMCMKRSPLSGLSSRVLKAYRKAIRAGFDPESAARRVAEEQGRDLDEVLILVRTEAAAVLSLDAEITSRGDGESITLGALLRDPNAPDEAAQAERMDLEVLRGRVFEIAEAAFGARGRIVVQAVFDDDGDKEIGARLGITGEAVRQIRGKIEARLRRSIEPDPAWGRDAAWRFGGRQNLPFSSQNRIRSKTPAKSPTAA